MKKIISIMILFIGCIVCGYGKVFDEVSVLDKFDDVIRERRVKVLVSCTDSSFVVEEKGKTAEEYIVICKDPDGCLGSRDNVVELVDGVYGFQFAYLAFKVSDAAKFVAKTYRIVDRYVSKYEHVYSFNCEIFWIGDCNGKRIIYSR